MNRQTKTRLKDTHFPLHLLTSQAVNYQLKELPFGSQMQGY